MIFELVFLLPVNAFFNRTKLVVLLLVLSPVHAIYLVYIGFMGNTRKYVWKGRLVR